MKNMLFLFLSQGYCGIFAFFYIGEVYPKKDILFIVDLFP